MYTEREFDRAKEILTKNRQEGILNFLNRISEARKEKLIKQILNLDFKKLSDLYKATKEKQKILDKKIEYIRYVDEAKLTEEKRKLYMGLGEDIIKNNQYAVVTMAGGQGTRLGHKGPKGTFKIDVEPQAKYLFQILAENLEKANKKYNVVLPWYIMTSTENNEETTNFFEEHKYFGYPKEKVKFFIQGNLPLTYTNGDLVIDKDYTIKEAADGNGCIYKAMRESGIIEEMKKNDIKWIFIGAVDNVLLNMVDPILLGLTIFEKNQVGSKSITKISPKEKVGVFCKANGVPSVIEYSELPEDMAEQIDEEGELLFGEAHIMCNLFSIEALDKISKVNLPYHVANKKTNYMNEKEEFIEVEEPNAYKYEAFIFDAFNLFDNISILRGKREENFAPVKNKSGNDSPETAIKLYNEYHRK